MDWKIVWTEPALSDLADIVRFIAPEDREAAERVGNRIVDHVTILQTFPEIGPIFRRRARGDVRQIICRAFKIYYRVRKENRLVEILHVWHGARQDPTDL
jgi:toxin ParE1/3/4